MATSDIYALFGQLDPLYFVYRQGSGADDPPEGTEDEEDLPTEGK